jgi:cobalt-zinc-cadmium efflux system membrane fusion protein
MKKSILLITVLSISFAGCKHKVEEAPAAPFELTDAMMARSEFTAAHVEEAKNELRLFGKIAADNARQAQVYPVVSGNVLQINVELGDLVKQGQVLASVRSSEVADFQRQLLDAKSDAALAEKNLQVAKELYAGKLNSERDVTAATKELEKSRAELDRINEVYNIYNLKPGSIYNITAPISGFVVSKNINKNEQLRSDKSDVIFSIAQIDEVWTLANVNESDISKVAVGYDASVKTISYPDKLFKGKIDKIFNAIDPDTKAMKVLVRIPNPDLALKPEMNAMITISYSENKKMIAIPSSAVIFDKSKNWVMVFKDRGHIETRLVEVYNQLGDVTYISAGLVEGEKVISKNGLMIYDALND